MPLFFNPFKPKPPATPQVPPVPADLPKVTAPTAAQIAQTSHPSPEAQAILQANPQQTPAQYLGALQEKQMGGEMVKTLAHGMPDREGVHWAAQSAGKVSDKLPPSDAEAMKAAQAWANNPTPENKAAAAAAAAKTNHRGPGALAAQGAAWAQPATPAVSATPAAAATPGATAAPRMSPHAVAGAVLLSAAIKANPAVAVPALQAPTVAAPTLAIPAVQAPQMNVPPAPTPTVPPAVQAQTFQDQHPFIAMGLDIASGKSGVG